MRFQNTVIHVLELIPSCLVITDIGVLLQASQCSKICTEQFVFLLYPNNGAVIKLWVFLKSNSSCPCEKTANFGFPLVLEIT